MFENYEITVMFVIAQAVGFVATGIAIYSFQAKHRITMLTMQTVSNLLWMMHYLILGNSLSAVFANLIGTTRNVIYGMRGKYKFADSKIIPAFYIAAFIISGIFTYTGPIDILPTLAMVCASIAFFVKEEKLIRYISVLIAISWLSFGIYHGSIASIVSDGSTLVSIIIAIIRYGSFGIYEKHTPDLTADKDGEQAESELGTSLDVEENKENVALDKNG